MDYTSGNNLVSSFLILFSLAPLGTNRKRAPRSIPRFVQDPSADFCHSLDYPSKMRLGIATVVIDGRETRRKMRAEHPKVLAALVLSVDMRKVDVHTFNANPIHMVLIGLSTKRGLGIPHASP